jgi:hypothetical protein
VSPSGSADRESWRRAVIAWSAARRPVEVQS